MSWRLMKCYKCLTECNDTVILLSVVELIIVVSPPRLTAVADVEIGSEDVTLIRRRVAVGRAPAVEVIKLFRCCFCSEAELLVICEGAG
jgi:hypothetical protein